MRTLIATDGSEEATMALRTASGLLRKENNEFSVLCVAPEFSATEAAPKARPGLERRRQAYRAKIGAETNAILNRAKEVLTASGVEAKTISEFGSPARVILRQSEHAQVTVVGATGKRDSSRVGIGPVASRVLEHASGTVLVARQPKGNLRVLLPVDGSAASRQALRVLRSYFDVQAADITVMHVVETPWLHLGLEQQWFDYPADVFEQVDPGLQLEFELGREAESIVENAQQQLEEYALGLRSVVTEGNPATEILGEAEQGEYDLIVLGASGASDVKHQILGSVSAKVAAQASCSVAVVKFEG
jgi:nucleotide-binding universal stress UspA family protein